ncbi:hypothetical protein [Hydrogenimonas sp.]
MTITDQYLEALQQVDEWITVGEWAVKISELFPELLENAEKQAKEQQTEGL